MRWRLIVLWFLALPAFLLWHYYGAGREHLRADNAAARLAVARQFASVGDWNAAVAAYTAALEHLPADRIDEARKIRLARSVAKLRGATFAEGRDELTALVNELTGTPNADEAMLGSARTALAYARYHTGWLMRLEGKPPTAWEAEIEAARQNYRVVAEWAASRGETANATRLRDDLESTVRFVRLDLSDLQGKSLPEALQNSSSDGNDEKPGNVQGKKAKGKKSKGEDEGEEDDEGENPGPGRNPRGFKDARGASAGPPPDTGGH